MVMDGKTYTMDDDDGKANMIRCLRFTKLCWVGKHINIIMKPTNSPTQGQPNRRKIRLKVAFGPLFPTLNNFSWVGIDFTKETERKKPNPTKYFANTYQLFRKHPSWLLMGKTDTTAGGANLRLLEVSRMMHWLLMGKRIQRLLTIENTHIQRLAIGRRIQ